MASLVITIRVYLRLRNIEQRYVRRGVMPQHMRRLSGFVKGLEESIRVKDQGRMRLEVLRCSQVLNAIHPLLEGKQKVPAKALAAKLAAMHEFDGDTLQLSCEGITIELHGERERLRLLSIEYTWRTGDGD